MKKLISIIATVILIFSSFSAFAKFDDIDSGTLGWAGEAIHSLTDSGVINGYEDGTFRPGGNVTRAEFSKMIVKAFNISCCSDIAYDDTSLHWANEYIAAVADLMYTEGDCFEPDKAATRADIAYCVSAVLELELKDKDYIKKYSDYANIPEAMKTKVVAAVENGMIIGYDDMTLRPEGNVTRAEASVIVYRALNYKPEDLQKPREPDESEKEDTGNHIYNLYPGRDILLLVSSNKTVGSKTGDDAIKLTYRIANSETQYTSVVPYDTAVTGIKADIANLLPGDIFVMNTAFYGRIGSLHVLASFGSGTLEFDKTITGYGPGDYTLCGGKIKSMSVAGKSMMLVLEWEGVENTALVPLNIEANMFKSYIKKDKWTSGYVDEVDFETETEYIYIRYTNGVATDVMVSDFIR